MKEKDLRRLGRKQLLELLLAQTERADALEAELEKAKEALAERKLIEMESGTVADASMKLNGVFEAAQAAADQYIENIRIKCERADEEARAKAEAIIKEAEEKAAEREQKAEERLADIKCKIERLRAVCREINDFYTKITYVHPIENEDEKED